MRVVAIPCLEGAENQLLACETIQCVKHRQKGSHMQEPLFARFCTSTEGVSPAIFGSARPFSTCLQRDRLSLSRPMKRSDIPEKDQSHASAASSSNPFFRRTFDLFFGEKADRFFWERFAGKTFRKLRLW